MGTRIGDSVASLEGVRDPVDVVRERRPASDFRLFRANTRAAVGRPPGSGDEIEDVIEVGFGGNSVSPPGVTVRTLGAGIRSAEGVQETQEELRAKLAERREEQAHRVEERQEKRDEDNRTIELRRAEAVAAARTLISQLNETAGLVAARLAGREPEPPANRPTVQIGNETVDLRQRPSSTLFDVKI
ncbi:MAG: hypothetical protein HY706_15515 [Candidatus Hydrogenedentes bacterium]|nr:hypothetical protein [Candidatus Hydrogenedentota bacterium]